MKLRETAKESANQASKLLFMWAILFGPMWAQNVTAFLLWVCIVGMGMLTGFGMVMMDDIAFKAKRDKEWARERLDEKKHWFFNLLSFALLGVLAAEGWFWTAGFYALFWFGMYIIQEDCRKTFKKVLDE